MNLQVHGSFPYSGDPCLFSHTVSCFFIFSVAQVCHPPYAVRVLLAPDIWVLVSNSRSFRLDSSLKFLGT